MVSNLGNTSPAEFCRERTPWRSAGPGTPRSAFPTGQPPIVTPTVDELNHAGKKSVSSDVSPVHTMACASATAIPRSCRNLREFALVFVNFREIAGIFVKLQNCVKLR